MIKTPKKITKASFGAVIMLILAGVLISTSLSRMQQVGFQWRVESLTSLISTNDGRLLLAGCFLAVTGIISLARTGYAFLTGQAQRSLEDQSGEPVRMAVELENQPQAYAPGDPVAVTVSLSGEKSIYVRQLKVGLARWEHYEPGTPLSAERKSYSGPESPQDIDLEVYCSEQVLLSDEQINAPFYRTLGGILQIPLDASPPYPASLPQPAGELTPDCIGRVPLLGGWLTIVGSAGLIVHRWVIKASLNRPIGPALTCQTILPLVVSPPGLQIQPGEYGKASHTEDMGMSFWLPRLEWVEGELLSGKLLLHAMHSTDAQEIRIELCHTERLSYPRISSEVSNTLQKIQLAGDRSFQAGERVEIPFDLSIPQPGKPSLHTEHARVSWILKGVVSRHLKRDTTVQVKLMVYTGAGGNQQVVEDNAALKEAR